MSLFRGLAALNHELGIRAVYQNYACWRKLQANGKLLGAATRGLVAQQMLRINNHGPR